MRLRSWTMLLGAMLTVTVALWLVSPIWNFGAGMVIRGRVVTISNGVTGAVYVRVSNRPPRTSPFAWAERNRRLVGCSDHVVPGVGFSAVDGWRGSRAWSRTFHVHYWSVALLIVLAMLALFVARRRRLTRARGALGQAG